MKHLLFSACIIVLFASCKKGSNSGSSGGDFEQFLAKSQWTGTLSGNGYQFAPPATIRFKSANSFVIYAPFYLVQGGTFIGRDSLQGDVTEIEEMADGVTANVKTQLEHFGAVVFVITNRKEINASSPDPTNPNKPLQFELEVYDDGGFSLENSEWSGPIMTGGGPTAGMVAYPDLSTIGFSNNTSYYRRSGAIVLAQPTPQIPTPGELRVPYKKIGAAVFMSGYSEAGHLLLSYFGVLKPGNTKMMVFSAATGSRLPYYTQTIAWYGPIGQTPVIEKQ